MQKFQIICLISASLSKSSSVDNSSVILGKKGEFKESGENLESKEFLDICTEEIRDSVTDETIEHNDSSLSESAVKTVSKLVKSIQAKVQLLQH